MHIYTHTCNGILLNHKKNEILPSEATRIDLENILSKISKAKNKYCLISFICGI